MAEDWHARMNRVIGSVKRRIREGVLEFKPCPFCGFADYDTLCLCDGLDYDDEGKRVSYFFCECGASSPMVAHKGEGSNTEYEAIVASLRRWNRRHNSQPKPSPELERYLRHSVSKLTREQWREITARYESGESLGKLGAEYGVSRGTIHNHFKGRKIKTRPPNRRVSAWATEGTAPPPAEP